MDVALTGCTGFVGTHLTRALVEAGHHVTGLVRPGSTTGHVDTDLTHRIAGDLTTGPALRRLTESCDVVIHNAFDGTINHPLHAFRSHVLGTLQLLEFTRLSGASQFIFISTAQAYHDVLPDRLLDENHPARPGELAAAMKVGIEPFLYAYYESYGMNTSGLRPGHIYGIHHEWKRSWNFEVINAVTLGEPVDTTRGSYMVNVADVADAVVSTVGNYEVAGQMYNLVDCFVYDQDVAQIAKELTGSPSAVYDRKDRRERHHFVVAKAADALGVDLNRGLEGVREYVRDLLNLF